MAFYKETISKISVIRAIGIFTRDKLQLIFFNEIKVCFKNSMTEEMA